MRIALGMISFAAVGVLAFEMTTADIRYQSAELLYQQGEFERASLLCEKTLLLNPHHAPTRALYTEIQFILGRGKATPNTGEYDHFMQGSFIPRSEHLAMIDQALQRAGEHRAVGAVEAGRVEVRKALEFMKWLPEGNKLSTRRNRAEFLKILLVTDGSTDD